MTLQLTYKLSGNPQLLIADGAGTLFDPGSIVPAYAFQRAFKQKGLDVELPTVTSFMGRQKKEHIRLLLQEPVVLEQFKQKYNRNPNNDDVEALYTEFKNQLYPSAPQTEEIEGVKAAAFKLKEAGIPLIMTTGYDRKMADLTIEKLPWVKDVLTASYTSSDVENGRPAPDMIHEAMKYANIKNPSYAVKVGDTKVDMEAPDKANMPGIIVLSGTIKDDQRAREINREIGRDHLILPSLVEVINFTLDGTLVDRI